MKKLRKVTVDSKEYSYILYESNYNNKTIDYSEYININISTEFKEYFSNVGGHSREIIKSRLDKYTDATNIISAPVQLSPLMFYSLVIFEKNGTILDYTYSSDTYFYPYLKNIANKANSIIDTGIVFEKLNNPIYNEILNKLYLPNSVYSTGMKTPNGEEVFFGEEYTIEIFDKEKTILNCQHDLRKLPIKYINIKLFEDFKSFETCGKVTFTLENGDILMNSTVATIYNNKDITEEKEWLFEKELNKYHKVALGYNELFDKYRNKQKDYEYKKTIRDLEVDLYNIEKARSIYNTIYSAPLDITLLKNLFK